jgi:FSR family fosmidomycin resistance protein-like MFS transporter
VKQLALLILAHFAGDFYAGFLSPLLPLLQDRLGLSLTMVGLLPPIFAFAASGSQPLMGSLGDRIGGRRLIICGVALAAVFMSAIGLATNFATLVALLLVGGAGVSFFHPHAAAMTGVLSGRHRGLAMSLFLMSGAAGISIGPVSIVWLVSRFGLERSWAAALPGLLAALVLWLFLRDVPGVARRREQPVLRRLFTADMFPILVLFVIAVLRAMSAIAFTNFIPLMLREAGEPLDAGARALFLLLFFGSIGGMFGGYLADRYGGARILLISSLLACPLYAGFVLTQGATACVLLVLAGMVTQAATPVGVVMAQEMKPEAAGTVSGLMMGFGWWFGSLPIPLLAMLAEHTSVKTALLVACVAFLPAGAAVFALPKTVRRGRR